MRGDYLPDDDDWVRAMGYIPMEDLRELVETWQDKADETENHTLANVAMLTYMECADELEDLIE